MKNRIDQLFQQKKKDILSIYFTAGYPHLNDTLSIAKELEVNGADLLEIGIPFSDPLADGPVIQQSSEVAITNGMSINVLFNQLNELRQHIKIPVVLMGYYNPILQFGMDSFLEKVMKIGIDGLIIPDLPLEEYQELYQKKFDKLNLKKILLITPQTSEKRIRLIDQVSNGFIYAVSSASTTGDQTNKLINQEEYLRRISLMGLKNPILVGFGISNKSDIQLIKPYTSGVIIGSAFIKSISKEKLKESISNFIYSLAS